MSESFWKPALGRLTWMGVLLMALVAAAGYFAWAQNGGGAHRKTVTLEMSWKRGDTTLGLVAQPSTQPRVWVMPGESPM